MEHGLVEHSSTRILAIASNIFRGRSWVNASEIVWRLDLSSFPTGKSMSSKLVLLEGSPESYLFLKKKRSAYLIKDVKKEVREEKLVNFTK